MTPVGRLANSTTTPAAIGSRSKTANAAIAARTGKTAIFSTRMAVTLRTLPLKPNEVSDSPSTNNAVGTPAWPSIEIVRSAIGWMPNPVSRHRLPAMIAMTMGFLMRSIASLPSIAGMDWPRLRPAVSARSVAASHWIGA